MNNYKALHFPNFKTIKSELQLVAQPYIAKESSFIAVDNNIFYGIEPLWEDLKKFGATKKDLDFAAIITHGNLSCPHRDQGSIVRGLNFPLYNCENTSLVFYEDVDINKSKEYATNTGANYYEYDPLNLVETERVSYVDHAIVFKVLRIHDIHGAKDDSLRVTVSFRFSNNITFGLE